MASEEPIQELITSFERAQRLLLTDDEISKYSEFIFRTDYDREQWEDLKESVAEEYREEKQAWFREFMERAIRDRLICEWVERNVQTNSSLEKKELESEIEVLWRADKRDLLQEYLSNVLELGLQRARKKLKRKTRGGGYLGHAWEVIKGFIRLAIVLGIFAVAESRFQTIVFALLIMIYDSIEMSFSLHSRSRLESALGIDNQFKRILRLLKERESDEDREARMEMENEALTTLNRSKVRFYIHGTFTFIVWIITLWKLVTAIT